MHRTTQEDRIHLSRPTDDWKQLSIYYDNHSPYLYLYTAYLPIDTTITIYYNWKQLPTTGNHYLPAMHRIQLSLLATHLYYPYLYTTIINRLRLSTCSCNQCASAALAPGAAMPSWQTTPSRRWTRSTIAHVAASQEQHGHHLHATFAPQPLQHFTTNHPPTHALHYHPHVPPPWTHDPPTTHPRPTWVQTTSKMCS